MAVYETVSQAFREIFRMASETRASQTEASGLKPSHQSHNAQDVIETLGEFSQKWKEYSEHLRIGALIKNHGSYGNH